MTATPEPPIASIVVPTRGRPGYLDVALASIVPQALEAGVEVLVVSDGNEPPTATVADRHGVRVVSLPTPSGLNAARNAGISATRGALVVFVDDDIEAHPGWLAALVRATRTSPDRDVFGGPIRARLEGGGPRACGREPAPITTLDLGAADRDVELVWGANMAIRRSALERIGRFDEAVTGGRGDEEEWERRYIAAGGQIRYVTAAGVDHRRTAADARLGPLARSAYRLGRAARRYDERKGTAPRRIRELRTLAGCAWHTLRRRCTIGLVLGAHSAGRLREALVVRRP